MAGWIKMPLAMEVGLGPSDIVLDGEPSSPKKGHSPTPNFWPMSIVAKWSPILATAEHLLNKETWVSQLPNSDHNRKSTKCLWSFISKLELEGSDVYLNALCSYSLCCLECLKEQGLHVTNVTSVSCFISLHGTSLPSTPASLCQLVLMRTTSVVTCYEKQFLFDDGL